LVGQGSKGDDAPGVATGGVDAWADRVVRIVFGGHENDEPGLSSLTTGKGLAARDAGGHFAEEGALAEARITVEEGDLAGREPARREPAHRLGSDLAQGNDGRERFAT
jgi:hypothetical protein